MNKIAIFLSLIIASVIIWVGVTFYKAYEPKPAVFQGEIDAQTYNISSKIPGRISEIFVKKGDWKIHKGTVFVKIFPPINLL